MAISFETLEDKQNFARCWLVHRTYAGTGRACDIAPERVKRLLEDPDVKAFIEDREASAADKLLITHEYVLGSIKEVADEARRASDFGNALKGYDQLGKHLKMFTDKTEVDQAINLTVTTGVPDRDDDE